MRIAHINNVSGVASIIAKQQRKQGYQADVYVFNNAIYKQFGGIKYHYKSPISRWNFFRRLKDYDVWHYHYPYGSLKSNLEKRNKNKMYLKHYHGDDLRGKYEEDFCLVSTPDLLQYAPNGKWLPNAIDIEEVESIFLRKNQQKNSSIVQVVHYPYYKMHSFNDYYTDALSNLQNEKRCEITKISHLSHVQALETIASCDIVIGKILPNIGWFGKFELEGMAFGKPVITYISDELYEKYKPPVYRTTKDTFKEDLINLIEDNIERDRLAKGGCIYVKRYHSAERVVKAIQEYYDKLL
jgi:glycosyltransferase involved in cell wall biosynthesis